MNINKLKNKNPYNMDRFEKKLFFERMRFLTEHHKKNNAHYAKMLNLSKQRKNIQEIKEIPYVHNELFKLLDLYSVKKKNIFKVLKSSGTSGSKQSKIFLDKQNAINQSLVLSQLFKSNFGGERFPMLIIDKNPKFKSPKEYDAKTAAFLGFSLFGFDHTFLLNDQGKIDYESFERFIKKYKKKIFIFGFTSFIYEILIKHFDKKELMKMLNNSFILHGGGWKKMDDQKISNDKFKKLLKIKNNIKRVVNYYGMIEQAGSIFFECEKCNFFKSSIFSNVLIRNKNLQVEENGKPGLIQVMSTLPTSYPGHSILTEDVGYVKKGLNKCKCVNEGSCFKVIGRTKISKIRGCSDV